MSSQKANPQPINDDNALLELILASRKFGGELVKNWRIILVFLAVFITLSLIQKKITKATYKADLSFMVNEDEGSKLSGLSTVLEDIGFGLGGTSSEYNLEKIMELMRSKRILYAALMERITVKGKEDFIANHMIEVYNLHKVWAKKKPKIKDLWFVHDSIPDFTIEENTAISMLYKMIIEDSDGGPLLKSEILDMPAIMTLTLTTRNEEFAYKTVQAIYEKLGGFYIEKTTEKQRETYELISTEADSIKAVLLSKEFDLANFEDRNQSLVGNRAILNKARLEREVFILNSLYAEAVVNEEVAKFTLSKKIPFIQAIDIPTAPLKKIQISFTKAIIKGFIAGLLLAMLFLIGRRVYRDAIESVSEKESID
ncbi:MAG: hypothetical protein KDC34_04035 [Saprospiraceae bacterium]|nr:hypothetical protein [Saprospiraceae bacterium]